MKAAIYCRLSEEDKNKVTKNEDSLSIQNQKNMLLQYALSQGWEIYALYSDDDYTGADRSRPAFNRLLADAKDRKFDIILCKTQSRFTRELELVEKYIHGLFPLWGIRFVSIVDHADTDNKGNKKSRQINGLVNEWYLEDMSENIRSVLKNRRENGLHIGSFALYGYRKDPEKKGHLLVDEDAAAIVHEVFSLFANGYGKTAIARMLNDRGIPNPTEYKRLQGLRYQPPKTKNSTLWKYPAISSMLTNEMYIGHMVQGKYGSISYKTKQNQPRPRDAWYIVENTHEAIIEQTLWDRVQALLAEKNKPFKGGTLGLFAGKTRCMGCGYTMRSVKSKVKYYLQCPTHRIAKDACIGAFISAKKLEELILNALHTFSEAYLDIEELAQKIPFPDHFKEKERFLQTELQGYQKKADEYGSAIRDLYLDKTKGTITEERYLELSNIFTEEKEQLCKTITETETRLSRLKEQISAHDHHAYIQQLINPAHLERYVLETLIDHIRIGRRETGTKDIPIEIHWNF